MLFEIQSGANMEINAGNNSYQCQSCYIRADVVSTEVVNPNWRDDPTLTYVNSAAFAAPKPGTYGNAPKAPIPWPATKNVDMTLMKTFRFSRAEDVKLDIRADFFNLFNWVNWRNNRYGPFVGNAASFRMTNYWTEPPRTIQAGLRVAW